MTSGDLNSSNNNTTNDLINEIVASQTKHETMTIGAISRLEDGLAAVLARLNTLNTVGLNHEQPPLLQTPPFPLPSLIPPFPVIRPPLSPVPFNLNPMQHPPQTTPTLTPQNRPHTLLPQAPPLPNNTPPPPQFQPMQPC